MSGVDHAACACWEINVVRIQSSAALGHGLAGHRTLRSVSWVRAVSTNAASAALKTGWCARISWGVMGPGSKIGRGGGAGRPAAEQSMWIWRRSVGIEPLAKVMV